MKRRYKNFSAYQQTLFNKYEIDESYLQTRKQRRACLELLEKVDKNQGFNEKKLINKVTDAFRGTELHKKIASCMTITALMMTLQTTPVMAEVVSTFAPSMEITRVLGHAETESSLITDQDSFLNKKIIQKQQEVKNSAIYLRVNKPLENEYIPLEEKGVLIDGDSDVTYYKKQELKQLTIIDTSIDDWEILKDAVKEGEILLLDEKDNPLDAILSKLEEVNEVDSLNIISHGSSGKLEFKKGVISSETLEINNEKWGKLGSYLSKDGDIHLFGCNVAKGEEGKAFVEKLAKITNADVAASINPTGSGEKGGDWELEVVTGKNDINFASINISNNQFRHLLGPVSGTITFDNFSPVGPRSNTFSYKGLKFKTIDYTGNNYSYVQVRDWYNTWTDIDSDTTGTSVNDGTEDHIFYGGSQYWYYTTPNPPTAVTIKSDDGSEFSLKSWEMTMAGWGNHIDSVGAYGHVIIRGYKDAGLVGTKNTGYLKKDMSPIIDFTSPDSGSFEDIDEIKIIPDVAYNNSSGNAYGVYIDDMVIEVGSANEAPTESTNTGLTLNEGYTGNITVAKLDFNDDSDSGTDIIYTVKTAPSNGTLFIDANNNDIHDSGEEKGVNATFTEQDITDGNVFYEHDGSNTTSDSFIFTVKDSEGAETGNQTFSITVNAIDDETPTISTNSGLTLNEGTTATITTTWELSATDEDTDDTTLTYTVTTSPSNGQLENTDNSGVAISSFTQQHLIDGKIQYVHDGSNTTSDSFIFKVADGTPNELPDQTFSITITAVNDDPTISGLPTDITVTEDTASNVDLSAATLTDVDANFGNISLTLTAGEGTLSASSGGGVTVSGSGTATLTLSGTTTNINTYLNTASNIQYTGAENVSGNDAATITLTANDCGNTGIGGGTNVSLGTVNVDITSVNDMPTDIVLSSSSVAENTAIGTAVGTLGTTDADMGDTFTYALTAGTGDTDNTSFTIDGDQLKLAETPDYETKNSYSIRIKTTDRSSATYEKEFTITITDENEVPVASNVQISGTAQVEQVVTGSYTYSDSESDTQGTSTFKWYRSDDTSGTNKVQILGQTASTYTLTSADAGKYISFEVTPAASTGVSPGNSVESDYTGPIEKIAQATIVYDDVTKTYGDTFNHTATGGSGSGTFSYTSSDPTVATIDASTASVTILKVGTTTLTATKTSDGSYTEASETCTLTINKKELTATATATQKTYDGTTGTTGTINLAGIIGSDDVTADGTFTFTDTDVGNDKTVNVTGITLSGTDASNYILQNTTAVTTANIVPAAAYQAEASANTTEPYAGTENQITLTVQNSSGETDTSYSQNATVMVTDYETAPDGTYGKIEDQTLEADGSTNTTVTFTNGTGNIGLTLNKAEAQNITFSITGLENQQTNALTITPTPRTAAAIVITQDIKAPYENGGEFAQQPKISLKDPYGNICTNDDTTQVTASKADDGNWALTGTKTATSSKGIIAFTDLGAENETQINNAQITFSASGLTQRTSSAITLQEVPPPGAPKTVTAEAGDQEVTISWSEVEEATDYTIYQKEENRTYAAIKTTLENTYTVTDLENGITYYFKIRANNPGGESQYSNEISVTPVGVPDAPTNVSAKRGNKEATITFAEPSANGGSTITKYIVTASPGEITAEGMSSPIIVTGLANGTSYTFTVKAVNTVGSSEASASTNAVTPKRPSKDDDDNTTNQKDSGVEIFVNGKKETAATATTTKEGDKTITTVTVDDKKVVEKLKAEGSNTVVTIPVNNKTDVVMGKLNGQTVKNMETKEATLEIKTENVTYTLPASQINIDNVSAQIGSQVELKDITVSVKVAEPSADTVKIVEDSANKDNYQIVVKPIEFEITCSKGDKTVEVSKFNAYVERMIAIPDGIDPSKITTGIVLNSDGTFSHVPTSITVIEGKYYARINSLTNSTYSVIYNEKSFKDVENHWAKIAVNDMGSRLVVSGISEEYFEPNRDITRAEFATIVVRSLGLLRNEEGKDIFNDVNKSDWYYNAVSKASEYGLVKGYTDNLFKPNAMITRQEAMVMMVRAMKITEFDTDITAQEVRMELQNFDDDEAIASWAQESAAICIDNGIVRGYNNELLPRDNITRAETATIIRRILQKAKLINK